MAISVRYDSSRPVATAGARRRPRRRRPVHVPEGFVIEPSYALLASLRHRQFVELLAIRSPIGARDSQVVYDTFRSLGLGAYPGALTRVRVDHSTTPGMVHRVRDKVALRVVDADGVDDVSIHLYRASGGDSARFGLPHGSEVRVEAHEESFSVVWPTELAGSDILGLLGNVPAALSILVVTDDGKRRHPSPGKAARTIRSLGDRVGLVRVETSSAVLAWRVTDPEARGQHYELGLAADRFDESLIARLLSETGVQEVRDRASMLVEQARSVLSPDPGAASRDDA